MDRNPILFRQHRKPLITRYLIFFRHLRADRDDQIHRTDLLCNKADDIFRGVLDTKYDYFVSHIAPSPPCLFAADRRFPWAHSADSGFLLKLFADNAYKDSPACSHTPAPCYNYPAQPAASLHMSFLYRLRSYALPPPNPHVPTRSCRLC